MTVLGAVQGLLEKLAELDEKHFLEPDELGYCTEAVAERDTMLEELRCHCVAAPESLLGCLGAIEALGTRTVAIEAKLQRQRLNWIQSLQEMETQVRQLRALEEKRPIEAQLLNRLA